MSPISPMSKLLVLLTILLFGHAANAQTGLRWLQDSATLTQTGCRYTPDSLTVSFTNNSSSTIVLDTIDGPTSSWQIAAPGSYSNLPITPGSLHSVKLYLKTPNRFRNEKLMLNAADGTKDTLHLSDDVKTAYLASSFKDTTRIVESSPLGSVLSLYNYFFLVGNTPAIVTSFSMTGDSSFKVTRTGPDTLRPEPYHDMVGLDIKYVIDAYGLDTLRVSLTASPCDSVYHYVLIVEAKEPRPPSLRWYYRNMNLPSVCGALVTIENRLINEASTTKLVDSVRIVGDQASHFSIVSSSPPNRINNFAFGSGDTITYAITYNATSPDRGPHTVYLVAYSADGARDSVQLIGRVLSSRIVTRDTIYNVGTATVGEVIEVYTTISSRGDPFTISDISVTGPMIITYEGIAPGMPVSYQESLYLRATSYTTGLQEGTLTIRGADCDTALTFHFSADFKDPASVREEKNPTDEIAFDGRYLRSLSCSTLRDVMIVDLAGRIIIAKISAQVIDLSFLSPGSYIASTSQGATLKFVK